MKIGNVLSLFDGMSCGQIALNRAGIEYENYFASEIDKHAIKVTQHNYPNTIQLGDVTMIKGSDLPKIDLLIGGSPCQGFSFAGKGLNFDDPRSKLFFEFVRLKNETQPKYWMFENVKMKAEHDKVISEFLGVEPEKINSSLVSAQNRERLYWANFEIKQPLERQVTAIDVIDLQFAICEYSERALKNMNSIDSDFVENNKLFFVKGDLISRENPRRQYGMSAKKCFTLRLAQRHGVYIGGGVCFLNRNECERLQNVPENYTIPVSENQAILMLSNGWTVDVIAHIFKQIK